MGTEGEGSTGFVGTAREICAGLVESLGLRLELFGLELQQEKRRLFGTVFLAMSASLGGFMALLFVNLALVATFWEHRVIVMVLLAGAHLVLALICVWIVRRRLAGGRTPFPATTEELRKDADALGIKR